MTVDKANDSRVAAEQAAEQAHQDEEARAGTRAKEPDSMWLGDEDDEILDYNWECVSGLLLSDEGSRCS